MEYLNWIAEHPFLTVILLVVFFGGIRAIFHGGDIW